MELTADQFRAAFAAIDAEYAETVAIIEKKYPPGIENPGYTREMGEASAKASHAKTSLVPKRHWNHWPAFPPLELRMMDPEYLAR